MEMMSWGAELLQSTPYPSTPTWFLGSPLLPSTKLDDRSWTPEENKLFEQALAFHDGDTPDRWFRVAAMTGKTVEEVKRHYSDLEQDVHQIELGMVPIPGYSSSTVFTLDWAGSGVKHAYGGGGGGRRPGSGGRGSEHERKKGVPWTEEEHRMFLLGLKKYGKGDWRSISRNYVQSRTPTQVASHAQKYFIRLSSGGKDKRRSSIHDITTVNVPDENNATSQPHLPTPTPPPVRPSTAQSEAPPHIAATGEQFSSVADTNRASEAALFDAMVSQANSATASQYRQRLAGIHESLTGSQNMRFQMQQSATHRVM